MFITALNFCNSVTLLEANEIYSQFLKCFKDAKHAIIRLRQDRRMQL